MTFLGHSTVLIEMAGTAILTDPVLGHVKQSLRRDTAMVPPGSLDHVDAVFISHGHFDHLDLPSLRSLHGRPELIIPLGLGRVVRGVGLATVHEVRVGDRIRVGGVEMETLPAAHGRRRLPWVAGVAAMGCLFSAGSTVYFAGDTDLFPAMSDLEGRVDVALLPVGGWGPRLGRGHMDPVRAAVAASLIRPKVAVPIHWGTLAPFGLRLLAGSGLQRQGLAFAAAVGRGEPDVRVQVLTPGASMSLEQRDLPIGHRARDSASSGA